HAPGNQDTSEPACGPSVPLVDRVAPADPLPSLSSRRSFNGTGRCRLPRVSMVHSLRSRFVVANRITADVDSPAGQPCRQPGILTFLTDRQRQLEVGYDSPDRLRLLVDDADGDNLGGGECLADEGRRILGMIDDIDLLAGEIVHHVTHPRADRSDTRSFGVDPVHLRANSDLRTMTG